MKNKTLVFFLFIGMMILSSCAPGNEEFTVDPAGFWMGIWHGLIIVVTYIISLFDSSVGIYESFNNGAWYNLGYIIGIIIIFGGSGRSSRKRCR